MSMTEWVPTDLFCLAFIISRKPLALEFKHSQKSFLLFCQQHLTNGLASIYIHPFLAVHWLAFCKSITHSTKSPAINVQRLTKRVWLMAPTLRSHDPGQSAGPVQIALYSAPNAKSIKTYKNRHCRWIYLERLIKFHKRELSQERKRRDPNTSSNLVPGRRRQEQISSTSLTC